MKGEQPHGVGMIKSRRDMLFNITVRKILQKGKMKQFQK